LRNFYFIFLRENILNPKIVSFSNLSQITINENICYLSQLPMGFNSLRYAQHISKKNPIGKVPLSTKPESSRGDCRGGAWVQNRMC